MADSDGGNLRSELGLTRRELIRRGALVGGTLLWAAPVIQSLTPPAYAAGVSPVQHFCCWCKNPKNKTCQVFMCFTDGFPNTSASCATVCKTTKGTNGRSCNYRKNQFSGPSPTALTCNKRTGCSH